ncbi:Spherulation-specific family 4 [Trametes gibbosa]|nr:Spherulation-specific family 4 [Trametes gibbosa]
MYIPRAIAAAATLASGVLVPLYIDPGSGSNCSSWAPLISTIQAHPTVPFWAVINPNSGPGKRGSQAPAAYQQCIPTLRAASANVVVLGYVPTAYGAPSKRAGVARDVDTYAGWRGAAYRPDGVFFDEVSGTGADVAVYKGFAAHAKAAFRSGRGFVAMNPGIAPSSTKYYGIADILLTAENFYSKFKASDLSLGSATPASKQAVVLTDGPSTPPTALISTLIAQDHVKAFYVTTDSQANGANPYDDLPTDLETFVAAVQAAQVS